MAGTSDPVQEFYRQLSALYGAAGKPTFDALARRTKLKVATVHDWLTGKSVPSNRQCPRCRPDPGRRPGRPAASSTYTPGGTGA